MKAPKIKKFANGGEIPKFKSQAEFDKYYQGLGYKKDELFNQGGSSRYYDPNKLSFDSNKKQYTGAGVGNGVWTSTPEASNFFEFTPQTQALVPSTAPKGAADTMRKPVLNGNPNYETYQYADSNGQYGNATTKYFDKTSGTEIDPSKSFDATGKYIPRGLKNGGLVKKYAWGGEVDENGNTIAGTQGGGNMNATTKSGIGIASQLGSMGGNYLAANSIEDDGTVGLGQATGAGALKGAGKGATMGLAFGPQGAAIGAGVGALVGAGSAYFGAKKNNEGIEMAQDKAKQDVLANEATAKYQSSLNKQMLERQQGFKDGGEIKGGLLPKSKTVDRFDPKNYGNKPILSEEELNKVMLNDMKWETESFYKIPPKGGSVINKDVISYDKYGNKTLSEPWYSADVEPTKTIPDSVLRAAPTYANGGEIKGKGGPKEDAIKAKVEAGSFIVPAVNAKKAEVVKEVILKAPSVKKKANLNQKDGEDVRLSNGEFMFSKDEVEKIEDKLGEGVLDKLAPNADKLEDKAEGEMEMDEMSDGGKVKGSKLNYKGQEVTYDGKNWVTKDGNIKYRGDLFDEYFAKEAKKKSAEDKKYQGQKTEMLKRHYDQIKNDPSRKAEADRLYKQLNPDANMTSKSGAEIEKITGKETISGTKTAPKITNSVKESLKFTPSMEGDADVTPPKTIVPKEKEYESVLSQTAQKAEKDFAEQQLANQNKDSQRQQNISKGLGLVGSQLQGLGNYALPYQQYKMGQRFLAETGKRPKGQIDPDFQNSVNQAQVNAQFGFTPEEQALLDSKNLNALRAGQGAAQNFSGGSSSTAYNMTRDAANQYYGRGLQSALANKNLEMQKKLYADQLVGQKADMNRQLFQDNLTAWTQNQQAAGSLIGMGLQNLIGANRYSKEQQFQNQMNQNSNPYAAFGNNNLTTG